MDATDEAADEFEEDYDLPRESDKTTRFYMPFLQYRTSTCPVSFDAQYPDNIVQSGADISKVKWHYQASRMTNERRCRRAAAEKGEIHCLGDDRLCRF